MKTGIYTNAFREKTLEEALQIIHSQGVSMVELGCGEESGFAHCNPEELLVSREYVKVLQSRLAESLSDLENRVLYLHLMGTDYKTIARLLDKSPKTVDNALQRIKAKLKRAILK